MDYIAVSFQGIDGPLDGRQIFARGYHGLLFTVLKQANPSAATRLHKHSSPKPFSTLPYYSSEGYLAGLRYSLLTEEATAVMYSAWLQAVNSGQVFELGYQKLRIPHVELVPGTSFQQLSESRPDDTVRLEFLSPTAFRQGAGHLPLPLPRNVFEWPLRVWQAYAPPSLRLQMPDSWLEWCARNVFVTEHSIQTATVAITYHEQFTGFIGTVSFFAEKGKIEQMCIWQAFARLAAFSGVGHKTTMGGGAARFIANKSSFE